MNRLLAALAVLPGAVAVFLGAVYLAGAVSLSGRLEGDGIDATTGVPLYSLEQILVQGIALVSQIDVLITAVVTVAGGMAIRALARQPKKPRSPAEQARLRKEPLRLLGFAGVIALFGLLVDPLLFVMLLPILIAFLLLGLIERQEPGLLVRHGGVVLVALVGAFALVLLIGSYLDPSPMPRVELALRNGERLEGIHVAHNEATWYVVEGDEPEIEAVSDSRVLDAQISPQKNDTNRSGVSYLREGLSDVF